MATDFGTISYNEERPTHLGLPVNEMADTNRLLAEKYQQNKQGFEQLSLIADQVDVRDVDMGHKLNAIANIEGNISEIVEINDFEYADAKLQKTAKEFATDKNLQGAIQSRQYQLAYKSAIEDKIKNNEHFSEDYGRTWLQMAEEHNADSVEYDEETGIYKNIFKFPVPNDVQDLVGQALELVENWKADAYAGFSYGTDKDGNPVWREVVNAGGGLVKTGTTKVVTYDEVFNSAKRAILEKPENQAYLNDLVLIENYRLNKNYEDIPYKDLVETSTTVNKKGLIINRYTEEDFIGLGEDLTDYNNENIGNEITEDEYYENLYYSLFKSGVVERAVQPAAQKAAFTEENPNYMYDQYALKAYQHNLNKKLVDYKNYVEDAVVVNEGGGNIQLTANLLRDVNEAIPRLKQQIITGLGKTPGERIILKQILEENNYNITTREELIEALKTEVNRTNSKGTNKRLFDAYKKNASELLKSLTKIDGEGNEDFNIGVEEKLQVFEAEVSYYQSQIDFKKDIANKMEEAGYKTDREIADELYDFFGVSEVSNHTKDSFYKALIDKEEIEITDYISRTIWDFHNKFRKRKNKEMNKYFSSENVNIPVQKLRITSSANEDAYINNVTKAWEDNINSKGGDLMMPYGNQTMKSYMSELLKAGDVETTDGELLSSGHTSRLYYSITPAIDAGKDGKIYNNVTVFIKDGKKLIPLVYKKKGRKSKGGNPVVFNAASMSQKSAKSNIGKIANSFIVGGTEGGSLEDIQTGTEIGSSIVASEIYGQDINETMSYNSSRKVMLANTYYDLHRDNNGAFYLESKTIDEKTNKPVVTEKASNIEELSQIITFKTPIGRYYRSQYGF